MGLGKAGSGHGPSGELPAARSKGGSPWRVRMSGGDLVLCHSQHDHGQYQDLGERVMVGKDIGLWVHFRMNNFYFSRCYLLLSTSY